MQHEWYSSSDLGFPALSVALRGPNCKINNTLTMEIAQWLKGEVTMLL